MATHILQKSMSHIIFPGGNVRPGHDADHSPPSSATVM